MLKVEGCQSPAGRLLPPPPGSHPGVLLPGLASALGQSLPLAEQLRDARGDVPDLNDAHYEATAPLSGVCGEVHGGGATPRLPTVKTHTRLTSLHM